MGRFDTERAREIESKVWRFINDILFARHRGALLIEGGFDDGVAVAWSWETPKAPHLHRMETHLRKVGFEIVHEYIKDGLALWFINIRKRQWTDALEAEIWNCWKQAVA